MDKWEEPSKDVTAWAYYMAGENPFIYAASGYTHGLDDLEKELIDFKENAMSYFEHGEGSYMFEATFNQAQTNEYGDVEHAEHWEVSFVSFKPQDVA